MLLFLWCIGGLLLGLGTNEVWGKGVCLLAMAVYCIASFVYMETRGWE